MSEKIWIAHPAMPEKPPVEILEKQYYIWRQSGWRATDAPPPEPTQKELAEADLKKSKPSAKKPSSAKK